MHTQVTPNSDALGRGGKELERLADFREDEISALAVAPRYHPACQSERRLYMAVLDDAIHQYRSALGIRSPLHRAVVRELEAWFASDDTEWPCSFGNICDIVGYDIGYFRRRLRRIKDDAERRNIGDAIEVT